MTWADLQRIYRGWVITEYKGDSFDGKQTVVITLEKKP